MVEIIRTQLHKQLEDTLRGMAAADPSLEPATAVILHPLRQLEAIASEVVAVLHEDDYEAMRRASLLLTNAVNAAPRLGAAESDRDTKTEDEPGADAAPRAAMHAAAASLVDTKDRREDQPIHLCPGGLIDLGALVLVGLTAARVGARVSGKNASRSFLRAVMNLALSAMPAESLAESLANGLRVEQLATVLAGLDVRPGCTPAQVVPQLFDVCGRARFAAIQRLYRLLLADVDGPWDTTFNDDIESVQRLPEYDGQLRIVLNVGGDNEATNRRIRELAEANGKSKAKTKTKSKSKPKTRTRLVFRGEDGRAIVAEEIGRTEPEHDMFYVDVPTGAVSGWLGIATGDDIDALHERRERLAETWAAHNKNELLLAATPVDLKLLPRAAPGTALPPPRTPLATWSAIVGVEAGQARPGALRPNRETTLVVDYRAMGPATVEVDLGDEEPPISLVARSGQASGTIPADRVRHQTELRITLSVNGRAEHAITHRLRLVTVTRRVALLRPTFSDGRRVSREDAAKALDRATQRVEGVEQVAIPWFEADDLQFPGSPALATRNTIEAWLAKLAQVCGQAEGLEDVQVLALIPGDGAIAEVRPAEGARAIGLVTVTGLARALAEPLADGHGSRARLRLVGRICDGAVELTEPTRIARRASGPGAPHASRFEATFIDASGRRIGEGVRLRTQRSDGLGPFVALLPVPKDASGFEIVDVEGGEPAFVPVHPSRLPRRAIKLHRLLNRLTPADVRLVEARTPWVASPVSRAGRVGDGEPVIDLHVISDDPANLHWRYVHSYGRPASIEVELGLDGVWNRAAKLASSTSHFALDLDARPAGVTPTRMRIVASDGWYATPVEFELDARRRGKRVDVPTAVHLERGT